MRQGGGVIFRPPTNDTLFQKDPTYNDFLKKLKEPPPFFFGNIGIAIYNVIIFFAIAKLALLVAFLSSNFGNMKM